MNAIEERPVPHDAQLPPGPRTPAVVQSWRYLRDSLGLFDECFRDYGDTFTLRLASHGARVFISSPEAVKQLYMADPETYRAGEAKARVFGSIVGHTSSLVLDGEAHLKRRRLLLPTFHGEQMLSHAPVIYDVVNRDLASWQEHEVFSLHPRLQRLTLSAILTSIFGPRPRPELVQALIPVVDSAMGSPLLFVPALQRDWGAWSPWGRLVRQVHAADTALYTEIRNRKERSESGQDIMGLLLGARDESGNSLSDRELRDELMTMVITGHEITALTTTWTIGTLLDNPTTLAKVLTEIDEVLGDGALRPEHVMRLVYLDAAVKETMRLHSAVADGSTRLLVKPLELGGYVVPAGVLVSVCMHLLHRRPEIYAEPDQFRPERFLEWKPDPYEWAPFGGGIRRCLGMPLGVHGVKVLVATVLQKLRLRLADKEIRAVRRGAFMAPYQGLRVSIDSRRQSVVGN